MIPFVPINDDGILEATEISQRDIEIDNCLKDYQRALLLQQNGNLSESKEIYDRLLQKKILKEKLDPIKLSSLQNSKIHTLQFVVFKNYAKICEHSNEVETAVEYYIKAHLIDSSDLSILKTVAGI